MILFLDFDGTTHPIAAMTKDDFCCLPRVEKVLREFPHVQVVISSWWRATSTLEQLREHFSEDIRSRVIGATAVDETPNCEWFSSTLIYAKERGNEVDDWIAANGYLGPWVALDDDKRGFPKDCDRLILCDSDVGVDAEIEQLLREYFNRYLTEKIG